MRERITHILQHKKTSLWLAFLIPFVITIGICIGHEIYPFGDQCFLHVDMYHQYAPFFTEFMNRLKEGGSLTYSWNLGVGTDFVSLMAYYLSSPFNWFLVFCPSGLVIEFMTVLIVVKIGLAGLTFAYYLRRHYHDMGYRVVLFSTFYALCGFICAYNWNIMWLDTVWLAPLIILGLELLVKEGRCALYFVTLAVSILSNYYVSIMVCIFLVLYFVVLFLEQREHRVRSVLCFGGYSLLAGGTAAVLILPEIALLSNSGSGGIRFPDKVEWYFGILDELARACIGVEVHPTTGNWPNLYCGVAVLLLFFLFLLNGAIKWQQKLAKTFFVVLFLVSFANNQLDFIWHGLHFPDGLAARESFLFSFILLVTCYETLHEKQGNKLWHVAVSLVLAELLIVACYLFTDRTLVTVQSMLLSGIVLCGYAMIYAIHLGKDAGLKRLTAFFALVLVVVESAVNMEMTSVITTNRYSYQAHLDEYKELTENILEEDTYFYRIDKFNRLTKNESALSSYPSATIFSSLINIHVADFYRELGMEGGKNYYCYNGATMLTSGMLSVKYLMTDSAWEDSPYRKQVGSCRGMYLYENLYTLPLGFMIDSDLEKNWDYTQGNSISAQNMLGYQLGAEEALLEPIDTEVKDGVTTIHVSESAYVYGYYYSKDAREITAVAGERTRNFEKCDHVYLLDLGYCEAGTDITLTSPDTGRLEVQGYAWNDEAFAQVYQTLCAQTMILDDYSDTRINGHIDVKEAGSLMLSVPNDAGWEVLVDGEKTEYESFADAWICIPLSTGQHTISLAYHTPYLKVGALISVLCVLLFAVCQFLRRKSGNRLL